MIQISKGRSISLSQRRSIKFQNETFDTCWSCNRNLSYQIITNNSGRLRCLSCSIIYNVFSEYEKLGELMGFHTYFVPNLALNGSIIRPEISLRVRVNP